MHAMRPPMPLGAPTPASRPQPMGPAMGPPAMPGMSIDDLNPMPAALPVDGAALWGNPVLDAPPVDLEAMFPEETSEQDPLGLGMMGMGQGILPAGGMDPAQIRMAAQQALSERAKARLGASQGFQNMAQSMAGQKY